MKLKSDKLQWCFAGFCLVVCAVTIIAWLRSPAGTFELTRLDGFILFLSGLVGLAASLIIVIRQECAARTEPAAEEVDALVEKLKENSADVQRRNEELTRLATRDSLTDCLNRRGLFIQFENLWKSAQRYQYSLAVVMVDIDFFKSINDQHGHAVGDTVLTRVASILRETARETDIVCRYGGEEFVILLPHSTAEDATQAAERFRSAFTARRIVNLVVSASFGVSCSSHGAGSPEELLEEADQALYRSKRNGRNRVTCFDRNDPKTPAANAGTSTPAVTSTTVPFHAVTALVSALAYRDHATAEHSRRVADLCVQAAESLMSCRECYYLELAAMLHDIGKVGVPDSILLKPARLNDEEWELMRRHQRIGSEIIRASFASEALSRIVEHYQIYFDGSNSSRSLSGDELPLGARILAIADSFDAMVTDRIYRRRRSWPEAIAELRRCAGTQFDPELVEHFISAVEPSQTAADDRLAVSRETALSIGLQLERLASALDNHDLDGLRDMATRLQATAVRDGASAIASKAQELTGQMNEDSDLYEILQSANELMSLCRSAQNSLVRQPDRGE